MKGENWLGPVIGHVHENGEIVDLVGDSPRRSRRKRELRYMLIEQEAGVQIMPRLSPLQTKIVYTILADYREGAPWARMTAAELGREVGVIPQHFYRALKPLTRSGIVLRPSKTMWQVNPHIGWHGARRQWIEATAIVAAPNMEVFDA